MAALTSIALIGSLVLGAAGTGVQFAASQQAAEAQKKQIKAHMQAEEVRRRSMQLEATRKRRDIVRQSLLARAQATAQATAQGAQHGSTLPGAQSAIAGQAAYNVQGVNQAETLGGYIFDANRDALSANMDMADAQSLAAIGGGLSSLGGSIMKQLGPIGRLSYGF